MRGMELLHTQEGADGSCPSPAHRQLESSEVMTMSTSPDSSGKGDSCD